MLIKCMTGVRVGTRTCFSPGESLIRDRESLVTRMGRLLLDSAPERLTPRNSADGVWDCPCFV